MLKKKYRESLTAKTFVLTVCLLTICSMLTYGLIAFLISRTYPSQINIDDAEILAYESAQELDSANIETSVLALDSLVDIAVYQFGADLELHIFDDNGVELDKGDFSTELGPRLSDYKPERRTREYQFSMQDSDRQYILIYYDSFQAVTKVLETMSRLFPYLLASILAISALAALFYSKYISAPILRINAASKKMISLDFDTKCETPRTDELGTLSNNLNVLAHKLSTTIGQLETANAQLSEDIEKERRLEKQRVEFFSAVSHELKTPITVAKGQLQGMIYAVGRYKDRDTYLAQSLEAINSLETMVQELLIVARMEAPEYVCNRAPCDISELVRQSLAAQEDIFIQKDIELQCSLSHVAAYSGDVPLLKRVFDNLISNARIYSPVESTIIVIVEKDEAGLRFSIENTGVHIESADVEKIFGAFYRPDQSRSRQTGGSGLGLYTVKKALDLHGAEYKIENSEKGVRFTICF